MPEIKEGTVIEKTNGFSECGHVDAMVELGFLQTGQLLPMNTGETYTAVIIFRIKEASAGRRSVTTHWMPISHCPICGERLKDQHHNKIASAENRCSLSS